MDDQNSRNMIIDLANIHFNFKQKQKTNIFKSFSKYFCNQIWAVVSDNVNSNDITFIVLVPIL